MLPTRSAPMLQSHKASRSRTLPRRARTVGGSLCVGGHFLVVSSLQSPPLYVKGASALYSSTYSATLRFRLLGRQSGLNFRGRIEFRYRCDPPGENTYHYISYPRYVLESALRQVQGATVGAFEKGTVAQPTRC